MTRSETKDRLLLVIDKPIKTKAYRAKFRPLETTKFLDGKALRKAKKATLEVGTMEIAGVSKSVAAEIRNGMVVALKPMACEGCDSKRSHGARKKSGGAVFKKTMHLVATALKDRGISPPALPMPIKVSARLGFEIPIGPIIIVIGDPGDGSFDLCFEIWIGNKFCW
jgi:hypothetical protein